MIWVVRHADGTYWDLGLGGDLWVEGNRAACHFTQRSRAAAVALRTGATVIRLTPRAPTPSNSTEGAKENP